MLRRLVHRRIKEGTLELSQQEAQRNPLPNHKGKGVAAVVICADPGEDEEETVTLATLQATKQRNGEDLMEYIKRFRDIALDCYDHCEERTLVEMCMTNMIREYRAVLENLEIS